MKRHSGCVECYKLPASREASKRGIILLARAVAGKWHLNLIMKGEIFKAELSAKHASDGGRKEYG